MNEQKPLPKREAWRAVRCAVGTGVGMLRRREVHQPRTCVGERISFADGTHARVFRETVVDRPAPAEPCTLVVEFRLRRVRGRAHALFRRESVLNTPLFVGFPGFVSKFWLADDENGIYRGLYEWDGADAAEHYARALWRVLELVSEPDSIHYQVLPGVHRDQVLARPDLLESDDARAADWWRPVGISRIGRLVAAS